MEKRVVAEENQQVVNEGVENQVEIQKEVNEGVENQVVNEIEEENYQEFSNVCEYEELDESVLYRTDEDVQNCTDSETRSDLLHVPPQKISIIKGHNIRDYNSKSNKAHVLELKESIKTHGGLLVPITCYRKVIEANDNKVPVYHYYVIDGECRMRAVNLLLKEGVPILRVPVVLKPARESEKLFLEMYQSNKSKRFSPYENSIAYQRFYDYGWSLEQIAEYDGKSKQTVERVLNLSLYSKQIQEQLEANEISASTIFKIEDEVKKEKKGKLKNLDKIDKLQIVRDETEKKLTKAIVKNKGNNSKNNLNKALGLSNTKEDRLREAINLIFTYIPKDKFPELQNVVTYLNDGLKISEAVEYAFAPNNNDEYNDSVNVDFIPNLSQNPNQNVY